GHARRAVLSRASRNCNGMFAERATSVEFCLCFWRPRDLNPEREESQLQTNRSNSQKFDQFGGLDERENINPTSRIRGDHERQVLANQVQDLKSLHYRASSASSPEAVIFGGGCSGSSSFNWLSSA